MSYKCFNKRFDRDANELGFIYLCGFPPKLHRGAMMDWLFREHRKTWTDIVALSSSASRVIHGMTHMREQLSEDDDT